jgi:hypothetical protein
MSDKDSQEDAAELESLARRASQNESRKLEDGAGNGNGHNRPSRKSMATLAMTPSLRGIVNNINNNNGIGIGMEPEALASEPRRKSSVDVDVDDLETSGVLTCIAGTSTSTSTSSSEFLTDTGTSDKDKAKDKDPLEIVAQQVARRKEQRTGVASKKQGMPKDYDANPNPHCPTPRSSITSQATEPISLSAKRMSLTNEEPNVELARDDRNRSSGTRPGTGTRHHFTSAVDVDDLGSQIQHPMPSLVSRNVSDASHVSDTSRASRTSLLVGAGAQEYLQLREQQLQKDEKDKKKDGRHERFSAVSERTSTSTTTTNITSGTSSTAADMDESATTRRRRSSGARSSGTRRDWEEFEQKRQSLPTSTTVAANMVQSPAMKQDESSWEQITAAAAAGGAGAGQPAKLGSLKNRRNPPLHSPDLHLSHTASTSSDSTLPPSHTAQSTHPPVETVQPQFMPPEQLVVATLIEEEETTNRSDTAKGNASLSSMGLDLENDLREMAPPPINNNENSPGVLVIVQAKPASASDSFWDLWRNRNGKILICTLHLVVVAVVAGVTIALGGVGQNEQDDNQKESGTKPPRNTISGTPESSVPTETAPVEVESVAPSVPQTMAPATLSPTSDLQGYLVSFLPNYSLPMLLDPTSAQSRALQWLLYDHDPPDLLNYTSSRIRQRFAMATFYYATEGVGWRQSRNWLSTDKDVHECDWWSHYDNIPGSERTSACNQLFELEVLAQNENFLRGQLPKEVAMLTKLTEISLVADSFFGFSSEENKKSKYISGPVPVEWMTSLINLKTLDLSRNAISGALATEIGMLQQLTQLLLLENLVSSTIPSELFSLPDISDLWLYDNKLTGSIPSDIKSFTVKLRTFAAGNNQLSGPLPSELGSLSELFHLRLESNQFSGTSM